MMLTTNTDVTAIDAGCGHVVYLSDDFIEARKRDHKTWYCSTCGCARHWAQKSDVEKLRAQLASTTVKLNRVRTARDYKERQRRAEKGAKTRIKNRIAKGACPCCSRTFQNLAHHMSSKHPNYYADKKKGAKND